VGEDWSFLKFSRVSSLNKLTVQQTLRNTAYSGRISLHITSSTMILLKVLLGLLLVLETVLAYNQDTCCELAKSVGAFVGLVPPPENQTCAQELFVNYSFCSSQCRGIQLSKVANAGEWAKP
jgi:hypothetical protein